MRIAFHSSTIVIALLAMKNLKIMIVSFGSSVVKHPLRVQLSGPGSYLFAFLTRNITFLIPKYVC